jgi:hypothetical protein
MADVVSRKGGSVLFEEFSTFALTLHKHHGLDLLENFSLEGIIPRITNG